MSDFLSLLVDPAIPFLRNALIAGLLISVAIGIVGSFVVVKRLTYAVGAITHASLAGVGISFALDLSPVPTQALIIAVALVCGVVIALWMLRSRPRHRYDSSLSILWTLGAAIGILLIAKTPGYISAESYLFGNVLFFSSGELVVVAAVDCVVLLIFTLGYRRFVAFGFDEEYLWVRGLRVTSYRILFLCLVALTVSILTSFIGIVLVLALMTLPAATMLLLLRRLFSVIVGSIALTALYTSVGIFLSYLLNVPTSSIITMLAVAGYLVVLLFSRLLRIDTA